MITRTSSESLLSLLVIFCIITPAIFIMDFKKPQKVATPVTEIPKPVTVAEVKPKPKPKPKSEVECLAAVIYHEARGESLEGQIAVGQVVLNRKKSRAYPNNICKVAFQPHQFTDLKRVKYDKKTLKLAKRIMKGAVDVVTDATHYHAWHVQPKWASSPRMTYRGQIGDHLFYKLERS